MIVVLIIFQALFFGLITAFLAGQKGYDIYMFYFIGLVVGPLGILSAFLPTKKKKRESIEKDIESELLAA